MIVATLLCSTRQVERVRADLPPRTQIVSASNVHELLVILHERPADVLVLDPSAGGIVPRVSTSVAELLTIGDKFPYLPILFYVTNPAKALSVIARFPTRERCDVIVAGIDDMSGVIAKVIESVVASTLVARLMKDLNLEATDVPSSVRRTIRQVFCSPHTFESAEHVAASACMSRRTLDRWLSRHGLVPAAELLHIARAFVAIRLERDHLVAREIHEARGFRRSKTIQLLVTRATRTDLNNVVASTDSEVIQQIQNRLRRTTRALREVIVE